ncbi:hypothetical protein BD310DRAFT_947397 [Dichomitus squalens]|uniref:Uncharacterized protein n=1 Tax=Dichomitus squalens TaxID=114155 RepID=A0A4Q9Q041_9APHY|nr:hypothetical protein BD310DRAFT_947397 [Dichomitus squalens]
MSLCAGCAFQRDLSTAEAARGDPTTTISERSADRTRHIHVESTQHLYRGTLQLVHHMYAIVTGTRWSRDLVLMAREGSRVADMAYAGGCRVGATTSLIRSITRYNPGSRLQPHNSVRATLPSHVRTQPLACTKSSVLAVSWMPERYPSSPRKLEEIASSGHVTGTSSETTAVAETMPAHLEAESSTWTSKLYGDEPEYPRITDGPDSLPNASSEVPEALAHGGHLIQLLGSHWRDVDPETRRFLLLTVTIGRRGFDWNHDSTV